MKLSDRLKGFTLTELMIVLLIVAILAAIAIPNYMKFVNRVREMSGW
jgi:prepilin-type N-terminal cleavage/methylation domain-containing protein